MKILHYTLGMPPYRTGGLTKYSLDLMKVQTQMGMDAIVLYPGHYNLMRKTYIAFDKNYFGIKVYELINPLPVSLLGGVGSPDKFTQKINVKYIYDFIVQEKPDIIHIHTLMGLPGEFVKTAKDLRVKTVFTTHDYYGICPKVNLVNSENSICEDYCYGKGCVKCNVNSYSLSMIAVMQSKLYRKFKNNSFVKSLRKQKNKQIQQISIENNDCKVDLHKSYEYVLLRRYYLSVLNDIDFIHYNSSLSQEVYMKYLDNKNGQIISITHSDIEDKRKVKKFNRDHVNFGYIGPINYNKGFFTLYDALKELYKKNINKWQLNVYGNKNNGPEDNNIIYNGAFDYKDLDIIYNDIDVLIVPSMWKETFGFIVLEALSHGVPCIISNNVGSKDIIENQKLGIVFNPENLGNVLEDLINNRNILSELNKNIVQTEFRYTMSNHVNSIEKMYNNLL